jgi:hypothetical protein
MRFFGRVFSVVFFIWGPDLKAKRISTFISYWRSVSNFLRIPAVAYNSDFAILNLCCEAYSSNFFNYKLLIILAITKKIVGFLLHIANGSNFEAAL